MIKGTQLLPVNGVPWQKLAWNGPNTASKRENTECTVSIVDLTCDRQKFTIETVRYHMFVSTFWMQTFDEQWQRWVYSRMNEP